MGFSKIAGAVAIVTCICVSLQADSVKSKRLPPEIVKALASNEKDYCDQFLGDYKKGCHETFRANLLWHELEVAPKGRIAFLVENQNMGFCGSAGCSLYLFVQQPDAKYVQALGKNGDVGELNRVTILKTVTAGYYDIQKTWRDGKTRTIYRWDGQRYSAPEAKS
jgi:hypothetical protein